MNLNLSREWLEWAAGQEDGCEVGAGIPMNERDSVGKHTVEATAELARKIKAGEKIRVTTITIGPDGLPERKIREVVIEQEVFASGIECCGTKPLIETIDTKREWQASYEYRVRCPKCSVMTTQCTWEPDAKTIRNNPRDRVSRNTREVENGG
jgi:hypothetical protein